ncbi:MAG: hypothetical protein AAF702_50380 [Chloroflexota bacterium]
MKVRFLLLSIASVITIFGLVSATLAQESIYLPMVASDSASQTTPTATSEATATPVATTLRTFTTGIAQNIYAGEVTIDCPNSRINRPGNYGELTDDDGNVWMVPAPVAGGFTNVNVYNDCTGSGTNDYEAELTTQTVDESGSEITAYLFADNYYEFYVNGTFAGRDSVPFIPFDSKAVRFQAEYPITYAVLMVDWEEYNGIGLENGRDGVSIGDGGFIATFSDGTTTNAEWVCKPFYIAPLDNNSCVVIDENGNADSSACNSTNETVSCLSNDPENSCMAYLEELPANWMAKEYDDSAWLSATTYTADDVTNAEAFRDYEETLFAGADFIWSSNLVLDNAVVCRATIDAPTTNPDVIANNDRLSQPIHSERQTPGRSQRNPID